MGAPAPASAPAPIFAPTAKQRELHDLVFSPGNDEILYGGARGGAKTRGAAWIALEAAIIFPGIEIAVCRRDFNDLSAQALDQFEKHIKLHHPGLPCAWKKSSPASCKINFPSGVTSTVWFSGAKDIDGLLGMNLAMIIADEAVQLPKSFYLSTLGALGRCRIDPALVHPGYAGLLQQNAAGDWLFPGRVIFLTNPGPGWISSEFPVGNGKTRARRTTTVEYDDRATGEKATATVRRVFLPAFIRDNPHLPPQFEANLRSRYGPVYASRMIDGDWSVFEGQLFPEFDPDAGGPHVISTEAIQRIPLRGADWTHLLCMDWGWRNPAAALLGTIDYDGTVWIWQEYGVAERRPSEHAPYLHEMTTRLKSEPIMRIDSAAVDQSDGVAIGEQFNKLEGYSFHFRPCKKRKHGPDGSIVYLKGMLADGRIRIWEGCKNLIRELSAARWQELSPSKERDTSQPERMVDVDDHWIDALFMIIEEYRMQPAEMSAAERRRADDRQEAAYHENLIDKRGDRRREFAQWERDVRRQMNSGRVEVPAAFDESPSELLRML